MLVFNAEIDQNNLPQKEIIAFAETRAVTRHVLKEYIITRLLEDENTLSQICEEGGRVGESLRSAALLDIKSILEPLESAPGALLEYIPSIERHMHFKEYQQSLEKIVAMDAPEQIIDSIIAHYLAFGGGEGGRFYAFMWDQGLRGIETPDEITLDQLFCLADQKKMLLDNTRAFIEGRPANNVLLYGNSGCGKSSMVKGIVNAKYKEGLRLFQIRKEDLSQLPTLIRGVKGKRFRYIIFIDDLSFEGDDLEYKTLKTILDGSIESQPGNIVFYATSNRLHLINETWAERKGEDVHVSDTRNEKLSLSERFGVRISFLSPGQAEYLQIVEGIFREKGITLTDALRADAIKWAWNVNGMSGRTAAQYASAVLASVV